MANANSRPTSAQSVSSIGRAAKVLSGKNTPTKTARFLKTASKSMNKNIKKWLGKMNRATLEVVKNNKGNQPDILSAVKRSNVAVQNYLKAYLAASFDTLNGVIQQASAKQATAKNLVLFDKEPFLRVFDTLKKVAAESGFDFEKAAFAKSVDQSGKFVIAPTDTLTTMIRTYITLKDIVMQKQNEQSLAVGDYVIKGDKFLTTLTGDAIKRSKGSGIFSEADTAKFNQGLLAVPMVPKIAKAFTKFENEKKVRATHELDAALTKEAEKLWRTANPGETKLPRMFPRPSTIKGPHDEQVKEMINRVAASYAEVNLIADKAKQKKSSAAAQERKESK